MKTTETGISKAVRLAKGQSALARLLPRVTPQAVQKWEARGYAPPVRWRQIEDALSGAVTRYELNPEVFGDAPDKMKTGRRKSDEVAR